MAGGPVAFPRGGDSLVKCQATTVWCAGWRQTSPDHRHPAWADAHVGGWAPTVPSCDDNLDGSPTIRARKTDILGKRDFTPQLASSKSPRIQSCLHAVVVRMGNMDAGLPATSPTSSPFDQTRQVRADGSELWSARDLMPMLGYDRWDRVPEVIERAKASAAASGHDAADLFRASSEKSGGRPRENFELARFACYLVAMNGDPAQAGGCCGAGNLSDAPAMLLRCGMHPFFSAILLQGGTTCLTRDGSR
ncbi:hypothetical protein M2280_006096 [Prescottella agglutinans]|uniref:Uncharacterized protein n=1 Tax=Prescottella agglutinans TaxID=1644129 RepID=A0ABT6MKI6_9NOCA|nr:hypothetical protein [Prescottella agglutinans]